MKKKYTILIALPAILFLIHGTVAAEKLTLAGAVSKGLKNNFGIRISKENLKIAENNNTWGVAGRYPTLTLSGQSLNSWNNDPSTEDPDERVEYRSNFLLPNINLTWSNNPSTRMMFPVGSRYFGAEVRPPVGIQAAFRELVLPRYRSAVEGLQILSLDPQPDLPQQVRSEALDSGGSAEGGRARIRYNWQGWQFDEEVYGVVEVFRTYAPGMFGPTEIAIWYVDYIFSFRAVTGRLDANAALFTVMIASFQLNPHWYAAFKSIVQFLAQRQIQHIRHIGEIGNIVAQAGREMREQNLRDWYARQEAHDQQVTNWSRAMRGVDAFVDPHRQEVVELPSGYGHAWANNLGEYILTEDSSLNPNLYSNLHWQPMEQQ